MKSIIKKTAATKIAILIATPALSGIGGMEDPELTFIQANHRAAQTVASAVSQSVARHTTNTSALTSEVANTRAAEKVALAVAKAAADHTTSNFELTFAAANTRAAEQVALAVAEAAADHTTSNFELTFAAANTRAAEQVALAVAEAAADHTTSNFELTFAAANTRAAEQVALAVAEAAGDHTTSNATAPVNLASVSAAKPDHNATLAKIASKTDDMEISDDGTAMVAPSDLWFASGEARLSPKAIETLKMIAKDLESLQGLKIIGHTDSIGDEQPNIILGLQRAEQVRAWLVAHGVMSPDAVIARTMGESKPIADNVFKNGADNPKGRAQNRRVEFQILDDAS